MKYRFTNTPHMIGAIPFLFLFYIVYVILTMQDRVEYQEAEKRGMHCVGSVDESIIIAGSVRRYFFDPNKKPERRYLTWSEFWANQGY